MLARVDLRALREQLAIGDEADAWSPEFLRFVIRLSEALDLDIPPADHRHLVTSSGCREYLIRRLGTQQTLH